MYFWTCLFGGVCPLQEWPSLSWCCWPVWTRAPTRGSTRLSPAACHESYKICSTVGQDLDAGAPCPTTLPPHTPPPPRTACTDKDWWAGERDTQRHARKACTGAHAPAARTYFCTQLCWRHRLQRRSLRTHCDDLRQMFSASKDSCLLTRTSICNHLSYSPQQKGRLSLKMSAPLITVFWWICGAKWTGRWKHFHLSSCWTELWTVCCSARIQ